MSGILAIVVELALPSSLRRGPFETVPLEKRSGFIVGLAVEKKLDTHCFGILPVGVAVVLIFHRLCGFGRFKSRRQPRYLYAQTGKSKNSNPYRDEQMHIILEVFT